MTWHRLLLTGTMVAAVWTAPACLAETSPAAGQLKSFKDWVIGCDNINRCTALGLTADNRNDGYVAIKRDGAANSTPVLVLAVLMQSSFKRPSLTMLLDGKAPVGKASWRARMAEPYARVEVTGADAVKFIDALKQAKTLSLRLSEKGRKGVDGAAVSFSGAAAALLYMDDQQQRVGTVTALIKTGDGLASSIPQPPSAPVHDAEAMIEIANAPAPPAEVATAADESCQAYDPITLKLDARRTLWGLCSNAAAYNFDYRFWIVGPSGQQPREVHFSVPGAPDSDAITLTNPGLSEDGMVLSALYKGRGIGDCGTLSQWIWNGFEFKLLSYSAMDVCGGVALDDWPVLFTAKMK